MIQDIFGWIDSPSSGEETATHNQNRSTHTASAPDSLPLSTRLVRALGLPEIATLGHAEAPRRPELPRDDASHQPLQPTFHPSIRQMPDSQASGFRLSDRRDSCSESQLARRFRALILGDAEEPLPATSALGGRRVDARPPAVVRATAAVGRRDATTTHVNLFSSRESGERTTGTSITSTMPRPELPSTNSSSKLLASRSPRYLPSPGPDRQPGLAPRAALEPPLVLWSFTESPASDTRSRDIPR